MDELTKEAPPRSAATVERWAAPMRERASRLRRNVVAIIVGAGALTGGAIAYAFAHAPGHNSAAGGFAMGFVPFFLIAVAYALFAGSDLKAAPALVRDGAARSGRIVKQVVAGPAKRFIDVEWDGGRGMVQVERLATPPADGDAVTILDNPRIGAIGVIVDGALYVGERK